MPVDWLHPPADEASWAAIKASPSANEASPFGPYIFTKLALIFFNCLVLLVFHAKKVEYHHYDVHYDY